MLNRLRLTPPIMLHEIQVLKTFLNLGRFFNRFDGWKQGRSWISIQLSNGEITIKI
jgi:hypothetical protein